MGKMGTPTHAATHRVIQKAAAAGNPALASKLLATLPAEQQAAATTAAQAAAAAAGQTLPAGFGPTGQAPGQDTAPGQGPMGGQATDADAGAVPDDNFSNEGSTSPTPPPSGDGEQW